MSWAPASQQRYGLRSHGWLVCLAVLAAQLVGCSSRNSLPAPDSAGDSLDEDLPYVMVLGTAQDAGLPQIACRDECCERARRDPAQRRLAASLLLVDPRDGRRWLFDATPDLREQVERARGHGRAGDFDADTPGRPALFDGIFLTHAHMGHCAGLLHLGREAYGSAATPVIATPRMCEFLDGPGLFGLLIGGGHIAPKPLAPGETVELAPDLRVTALQVPHRDECSDTVAFRIEGPSGAALYLPDIDKWERWDRSLVEVLATVDVAYLDGTFYGPGEIPGRDMAQVPHPFVVETMDLLAAEPAETRAKVRFLHLNHSNPAARQDSASAGEVAARGYRLAEPAELVGL